jgi:hypothetical protein
MKCLRCGYCCIQYLVGIISDPDKEIAEDNVEAKTSGVRCKYLIGDVPGKFSCSIHYRPFYEETPCFEFGQVESSLDDPCRMGKYILGLDEKTRRSLVEPKTEL